jgi:dolichol-phosphate mannosyltransferase
MKPSISLILPALDEEHNLEATVKMVLAAASGRCSDLELLIIDDGSQDQTGAIADRLASSHPGIQVVHNGQNKGVGYSFRTGVSLATKDFVGWLPADTNLILVAEELERTFDAVGRADFMLMYLSSDVRSFPRRLISQGFVGAMNLLFGLQLKYFNGGNFYRRHLIQSARMDQDGYVLFSGILIRLIRAGHSYVEVGVVNRGTESKSLRVKVFRQVLVGMASLFWEVRFRTSAMAQPEGALPYNIMSGRQSIAEDKMADLAERGHVEVMSPVLTSVR